MSAPAQVFKVLIVEDNPVIRDLFMVAIDKLQQEQNGDAASPPAQGLSGLEFDQQDAAPAATGGSGDFKVEVCEAGDGSTALDKILEQPFDLVVTDLYLPILDGIELIRRVRATPHRAHTRILAISASIRDAHTQSIGAGADLFLAKPLRLVELLDALRTLLKLSIP